MGLIYSASTRLYLGSMVSKLWVKSHVACNMGNQLQSGKARRLVLTTQFSELQNARLIRVGYPMVWAIPAYIYSVSLD